MLSPALSWAHIVLPVHSISHHQPYHCTVSIYQDIFVHLMGEESTNRVIFLSNRNGKLIKTHKNSIKIEEFE